MWSTGSVNFFKKYGISNAPDVTKDDVLFQESGSSDRNIKNDDCNKSYDDFRRFCDQLKLHTVMPFYWIHVCEFEVSNVSTYSPPTPPLKFAT